MDSAASLAAYQLEPSCPRPREAGEAVPGDRGVPSRASTDLASGLAWRGLENEEPAPWSKAARTDWDDEAAAGPAPSGSPYLELLRQNMCPEESSSRLLKFGSAPRGAPGALPRPAALPDGGLQPRRAFQQQPFRVLHAPGLPDDYYASLLDFSHTDTLAVGLGSCIDLWSLRTSSASRLCELHPEDGVASVKWGDPGAPHLAVGMQSGEVKIWDASRRQEVRSMARHRGRVGALAWSGSTLFTGGRDGQVLHWDLRAPARAAPPLGAHRQEVCGLRWSHESQQLASGGNEGDVCVWNPRAAALEWRLAGHQAGVRAIAWSPHERGLLASGGGSSDRCIRTWSTLNGAVLSCTDTGSQVCNLLWSEGADELLSSHGYWGNEIALWKRRGMSKLAVLSAHRRRAVQLALAPDGETLVTGTGDEMLRFWRLCPGPGLRRSGKSLNTTSCPARTIR